MDMNSAVQIVEKVGGKFSLNTEALNRILKDVLNKKVAVLTVAGAFRKGKSFFLSNCVRYLQDETDWMDPSAPVTGFTWRRSTNGVTDGILMWPEPFLVEDEDGEEIAILLLDTEGLFDHKSSMTQGATVFALAALLSSTLVFNVMQDLQEDNLDHFQFFASYGSYALDEKDAKSKPFQSLLFLIRDWQNGDQFGMEAGRRILDEKMKFTASSTFKTNIQRSFVDMKCCLLPNPGPKICRGSEGTITVDDMDPEFQEELENLVPHLIGTLLQPKEIGGRQVTGAEFLEFFKTYVKLFASGTVPEPKSIFDATAEATHQSALNDSLGSYNCAMEEHFAKLSQSQFFQDDVLRTIHQQSMNASISEFTDAKKMGDIPRFLVSLKQQMEEQFKNVFLKDNQSRIAIDRERKEKEAAETRRREQEQRAREEQARLEREKENLRIKMEKEKREKEEAERRRVEEARRHQEQMERERKEREEAERRRMEEQRRERERMERQRREREEEARREMEEMNRKMERMRLENERREKAREEETRRQMEEMKRENERRERERQEEIRRERQRREEAEREAREAAQRAAYQASVPHWALQMAGLSNQSSPSYCSPSYGGGADFFGASYSNASRSGTPSGRSPGRPRGSVMERFNQGILPSEGSRDWNRLQRDGYL